MKRPYDTDENLTRVDDGDEKMKKTKIVVVEEEEEVEEMTPMELFTNLSEDLLFEVLKYVDAKSLAKAGCVNKQWYKTSKDERLWEMICTRHWAKSGCGNQQLRSVVLALGGFRRLHSSCLWPLLKPPPSSSSSSSSLLSSSSVSAAATSASVVPSSFVTSSAFRTPPVISSSKGKMPTNWGKDEVNLSLSLLSIRYYETMNLNFRGRK